MDLGFRDQRSRTLGGQYPLCFLQGGLFYFCCCLWSPPRPNSQRMSLYNSLLYRYKIIQVNCLVATIMLRWSSRRSRSNPMVTLALPFSRRPFFFLRESSSFLLSLCLSEDEKERWCQIVENKNTKLIPP
jgi:hypothetical protein